MIDRTKEIGRCSLWDRSCSLLRRTVPVAVILVSCVSAAEDPRVFVTNEYFTFGSPDYFSVAVKLADFDSDDDLDALMVNGRHWARQDLVLFNNGDGRFLTSAPVGEQATGYSPTIVDLNHDGKDDLVIARDRIVSLRFMGLGSGKFDTGRPVGRAGPTRAVVSADLDNDGDEDLVFSQRGTASYVAFGPDFKRIVEFGDSEQYVRLAVADIDSDEDLDIVIANLGAEGSAIYLNDGTGKFDQLIRLNPSYGKAVDIAVGDFDGDGRVDVAVARIAENVIFLNDADHTFKKIIVFGFEDERSYGIDVGDLDRDGDIDIAIANDGVPNTIYINAGDATFERHILPDDPNARSYGVTIGDLNGDGFADLVYANSGSMSRVYLNATEETAASMLSR